MSQARAEELRTAGKQYASMFESGPTNGAATSEKHGLDDVGPFANWLDTVVNDGGEQFLSTLLFRRPVATKAYQWTEDRVPEAFVQNAEGEYAHNKWYHKASRAFANALDKGHAFALRNFKFLHRFYEKNPNFDSKEEHTPFEDQLLYVNGSRTYGQRNAEVSIGFGVMGMTDAIVERVRGHINNFTGFFKNWTNGEWVKKNGLKSAFSFNPIKFVLGEIKWWAWDLFRNVYADIEVGYVYVKVKDAAYDRMRDADAVKSLGDDGEEVRLKDFKGSDLQIMTAEGARHHFEGPFIIYNQLVYGLLNQYKDLAKDLVNGTRKSEFFQHLDRNNPNADATLNPVQQLYNTLVDTASFGVGQIQQNHLTMMGPAALFAPLRHHGLQIYTKRREEMAILDSRIELDKLEKLGNLPQGALNLQNLEVAYSKLEVLREEVCRSHKADDAKVYTAAQTEMLDAVTSHIKSVLESAEDISVDKYIKEYTAYLKKPSENVPRAQKANPEPQPEGIDPTQAAYIKHMLTMYYRKTNRTLYEIKDDHEKGKMEVFAEGWVQFYADQADALKHQEAGRIERMKRLFAEKDKKGTEVELDSDEYANFAKERKDYTEMLKARIDDGCYGIYIAAKRFAKNAAANTPIVDGQFWGSVMNHIKSHGKAEKPAETAVNTPSRSQNPTPQVAGDNGRNWSDSMRGRQSQGTMQPAMAH